MLPRRRPRAVYEVHDADDLLGDSAGSELATSGEQPGADWEREADGGAGADREAGGGGEVGYGGDRPDLDERNLAARRRERIEAPAGMTQPHVVPVRRVLAGALLCLTAIFAVFSIVLGLLSLAGPNTHLAQRQGATAATARQSTTEPARLSGEAPPSREVLRARPVKSRMPPRAQRRSRPAHRAIRSQASPSPPLDAAPATSASTVIAPAIVARSAADEFGFER